MDKKKTIYLAVIGVCLIGAVVLYLVSSRAPAKPSPAVQAAEDKAAQILSAQQKLPQRPEPPEPPSTVPTKARQARTVGEK